MADVCFYCAHFDPDDTALPICQLHRRFMHQDWTCGEFVPYDTLSDSGEHDKGGE